MKSVIGLAMLALACACTFSPTPRPIVAPTTASPAFPQTIELPAPRLKGALSLEETLAIRRSVREYADEELSQEEIGQLLWAAQGITSSVGQRTAPSAGGLYPHQVYIVSREGAYQYEPTTHQLRAQLMGDLRQPLSPACLAQEAVKHVPIALVIAAADARLAVKNGGRAPRYAHIEAGHEAQNVLLQAVALNLGAVPIGAFDDDQVKQVLALSSDQVPLYVIPVGRRK